MLDVCWSDSNVCYDSLIFFEIHLISNGQGLRGTCDGFDLFNHLRFSLMLFDLIRFSWISYDLSWFSLSFLDHLSYYMISDIFLYVIDLLWFFISWFLKSSLISCWLFLMSLVMSLYIYLTVVCWFLFFVCPVPCFYWFDSCAFASYCLSQMLFRWLLTDTITTTVTATIATTLH